MSVHLTLAAGLKQLALPYDEAILTALNTYLALLMKWNKVYNLTALRDLNDCVVAHLLDSLSIAPYINRAGRLLDMGSGAGLPGLPLALVYPSLSVVLLDANHKKTTFLRQAVIELQCSNVEVVTLRADAFLPEQKFDRITSRAFATLADFFCLAKPLLTEKGECLAMKGAYPAAEMACLPSEVTFCTVEALQVPGLDAKRHLVRMSGQ